MRVKLTIKHNIFERAAKAPTAATAAATTTIPKAYTTNIRKIRTHAF